MADMTACQQACAALGSTFGERAPEWFALAVTLVLGWWKARQVKRDAQASVQVANEQASKAKTEARALRIEVAEIRGSMRTPSLAPLPMVIPPPADVPYGQQLRDMADSITQREEQQADRETKP